MSNEDPKDHGLEARRLNTGAFIEKFSYISFDVFDTLIKRSVAKPADLFLLMENYLAKARPAIPPGFAQNRQAAEQRAKEKQGVAAKLEDIYRELSGEYSEYAEELMALETAMELRGCLPNPKCVEWFDRCVSEGKTVVLISDMYLPAQIIGEMLKKCGVHGYQKLYVSCEYGARKRDGSLFKIVLNELNIHPRQLVHIGDSKRGDALAPFQMGIRAVWVRNDQKRLCKAPKTVRAENLLPHRTVRACIRNCSNGMTEYEKMGCEIFGPLLYGFTQWLAVQLEKDGIDDIYFLSRDGHMLMRAFEELGLCDKKLHYLYCSRRSFQVAVMWMHPEFDDVTYPFQHCKSLTIRSLLLRLGLDPEKYLERAGNFHVDMDKNYEKGSIFSSEAVRTFYESIKQDVIENSKREYEGLVTYIKSQAFAERIAVVDVGWHGTMQQALEELLRTESMKAAVKGYYMGIAPDASQMASGEIAAAAYLFDPERNAQIEQTSIKRSVVIFEAQFLAMHGSVKRFVLSEDTAIPEFEAYEYTKDPSQRIDEPAVIGKYQNGALPFVRYMKEAFPQNTVAIPPETAISGFSRLVCHPTLREARLWGDIRYINYQVFYCACPQSGFRYLAHPREFARDYFNSKWRVGFMRRLFRIPLPYDKITDLMKKLYDKL